MIMLLQLPADDRTSTLLSLRIYTACRFLLLTPTGGGEHVRDCY